MSGISSSHSLPEPVRAAFAVVQSALEDNRFAHAHIITSANMEWGVLLARLILQQLFCNQSARPCGECRGCQLVETRRHADVVWLEPEMKSRVIGIESMRETNNFLRQTSFEGGWKAAVLVHADRMNDSAANAFLKTLEEPPDRCVMLLVTDSPQSLLPTILSRCQMIPVGVTGAQARSKVEAAMIDWLGRRTGRPAAIEQATWISAVLNEVRERAETAEKERAGEEDVEEDVLKARVESQVKGARGEILRTMYQWERDVMVCAQGGEQEQLYYPDHMDALRAQGAGLTLAAHLARLDQVSRASRLLEGNVPEQAVWEAVLPA